MGTLAESVGTPWYVSQSNGIVILELSEVVNTGWHWEEADLTNTVHKQLVPGQAFLELGAHGKVDASRRGPEQL